jgi:hypothetical protein
MATQISASEVGDRGGELQEVRKWSSWSGALPAEFTQILPLFPNTCGQAPFCCGFIKF